MACLWTFLCALAFHPVPQDPVVPFTPLNSATQKRGTVAAPDTNRTDPRREEHVIYVPFSKLPEVFEKEGASVLVPYAQFLQLWSGSQVPVVPIPVKPPVVGLISRADYAGRVQGELVRFEVALTVEVLGDEWVRIPVTFGDASVGEVSNAGEKILLRGVGDGQYELLAQGRGTHKVLIDLVARVQSSAEGKSFAMRCPTVSVTNLRLEIAEGDILVQVSPRRTSQIQVSEGKVTNVQATLGSTDKFSVTWQPKSGGAAELAGLASVSDTITVFAGDGVVHTHAIFDYHVQRGLLDALVIALPAGDRLLDVQSPGMRDWHVEPIDAPNENEAGQQRLTVRLHAPVRDQIRLELRTETPIPDAPFRLAQLSAVGVARETGTIAVGSSEDLGLEIMTLSGLSRIDGTEVPESMRKPRMTYYKFFNSNFELAAIAAPLEPRVAVESFLTVTLDKVRTVLRGDFAMDIARAGVFSVPIRIPAGYHVDEVQCDLMDRHEIVAEESGSLLTVFLNKRVLGPLKIEVIASQPYTVQAGDLSLPLMEPLGVAREQALVAVFAPESIEINTDPARMESARTATPAELSARGLKTEPPQGSLLAGAFAFTRRPVVIGLATRERPRRIVATVGTSATVKEDVVSVLTTVNYEIQFAGTDSFRLAIPAGIENPQIECDGIKEKRIADQPNADGSTTWTIVLHAEAMGSRRVTVNYDRRISVPETGITETLQPVRLLDVDRESGEIIVLKDRALALRATVEGLEEIDSRELTIPPGAEQPYLSYRYFRHPAQLTLSITKHEIEGVVKTIVTRAYVEAAVSLDGPTLVRARWWVKSSERQRLALTLPARRILGVMVAGRHVLPEKAPAPAGAKPDEKSYFINIDRPSGPDEPFTMAIIYEAVTLGNGPLATTDRLHLPLPQFESGVKFQQLYVRLWMPDTYRAVGEPPGFSAETRPVFRGLGITQANYAREDPDTWFPAEPAGFDFRTTGQSYVYSRLGAPAELVIRYWSDAALTLAGSLTVLLVGVVLVFFRLEVRVLAILAAVLLVLMVSLFRQDAVVAWVASARIGMAAVLALWLVVFLLRIRHAIPLRMAVAAGAGTVLLSAAGSSTAMPQPPPSTNAPAQEARGEESKPPTPPETDDESETGEKGGSHENA